MSCSSKNRDLENFFFESNAILSRNSDETGRGGGGGGQGRGGGDGLRAGRQGRGGAPRPLPALATASFLQRSPNGIYRLLLTKVSCLLLSLLTLE